MKERRKGEEDEEEEEEEEEEESVASYGCGFNERRFKRILNSTKREKIWPKL